MKQVSSYKKTRGKDVSLSGKVAVSRSNKLTTRNSRVVKKVKSTDNTQYVLPLGNGWVIKGAASATFTAITDSKAEAIAIARNIAQTKHTALVVHGKTGTIEVSENYTSRAVRRRNTL